MKTLFWALALSFMLLIQATWLPMLAIQGVKPDLLLIAVTSAGLLFGKEAGVGIGFYAGILQDLTSGNLFGLNILSKMAVGYLFGYAERNVFKENLFLSLFAVALATVLDNLVVMVYLYIFGYHNNPWVMVINSVLPLIAYNILFAIPIHLFIYKWNKRLHTYLR